MTDDELERALFALPLAEAPGDLRGRILAATIARPRLAFATWEIWIVATVLACMAWLAFSVATSAPDAGGAIARGISLAVDRLTDSLSASALMWMALGVSSAVWISQLSVPTARRKIADR